MAWSIRNYNAYLRAAKSQGLSHREAQQVYRAHRAVEGRSLKGVDVKTDRAGFRGATTLVRSGADSGLRGGDRGVGNGRGAGGGGGGGAGRGGGGKEAVLIYPDEFDDLDYFFGGEETDEEAEY